MKILIIHRHYWPDTQPFGAMLRAVAEHLAARGHRVTMFTAYPSGETGRASRELPPRQFKGGVRIVRAPLPRENTLLGRLNQALFLGQAFAYAARHRFALVWITAAPPVAAGLVGMLAARVAGALFLYHVQRVFPEASDLRSRLPAGALERVDSWICRNADAVVVPSEDMVRTIADRGGNGAVAFQIIEDFVPERHARGHGNATACARWADLIQSLSAE